MLSKHLETPDDCLPGLPRSSSLVFLCFTSLAVSAGFPGVSGYLVSTWDHLSVFPGPAAIFAAGFFMTSFPALSLVGRPPGVAAPVF